MRSLQIRGRREVNSVPAVEPRRVPLDAGSTLDAAREADAQWRDERAERHAERVRRLHRWIGKVERGTARCIVGSFLVCLCVMIGSLYLQSFEDRRGRSAMFRSEVWLGLGVTVAVTLTGAFCEAVLRWRLRKVMERGWRDGIELGD